MGCKYWIAVFSGSAAAAAAAAAAPGNGHGGHVANASSDDHRHVSQQLNTKF